MSRRLRARARAASREPRASDVVSSARAPRFPRSARSLRPRTSGSRGAADDIGDGARTHRPGDGAGGLDRRLRRAHRHDDAWRAGRVCGAVDHRPQLRDQAGRAGRVRPLHDRDGTHRARGVQPRARTTRRRELAGVGVGADGHADAAAGRRHVRRRRAGPASPRAGDFSQRAGWVSASSSRWRSCSAAATSGSNASPSSRSVSSRC